MKVVLFCGGMGMRLREYSANIPKPMVPIGYRPVLWHVMKYYAYHGHTDFILCLGYKADYIKNYFLNYNEAVSNDFVMRGAGESIQLLSRDIDTWNITFADTGVHANIGQRLLAVRKYIGDDETFLANYSDGLSNVPLDKMLTDFHAKGVTGSFVAVKPQYSYHIVKSDDTGNVTGISHASDVELRINGGYFIFNQGIFDQIHEGEDLVPDPFNRLVAKNQLLAYKYDGFWASMDTFKDKQVLDELDAGGNAPWQVWKQETQGS